MVANSQLLCHQTVTLSTEDNAMYWHRIKDLREDHDLTQQQVANILNCQREVYRRYETGTRELPLSYAIILANYYGVSIDYIVELTDRRK